MWLHAFLILVSGRSHFVIDGESRVSWGLYITGHWKDDRVHERTYAVPFVYDSETGGTEFLTAGKEPQSPNERSLRNNDIVHKRHTVTDNEGYSSKDGRALSSVLPDHSTDVVFLSRHLLDKASNTSKNNTTTSYASLNTAEKTSFTVAYIIMFLIGLTGNLLILITIKSTKELHTDLNYLLCNIAISDILRMLTLYSYEVFVILALGNANDDIPALPGVPGDILCKAMWSLPNIFAYVFAFTLLCMTAERFVAVVFPFRITVIKGKTKWFIFGIWFTAILLVLPFIYATKSIPRGSKFICEIDFTPFCSEADQGKTYRKVVLVDSIMVYVVPIFLILVLHAVIVYTILKRPRNFVATRQNSSPNTRGVIPMLGTVTIIFVLFWLPNQVYTFLYIYQKDWLQGTMPVFFTFLLLFISELNSMINPWIYPLYVKRFRKEYAKLLRRKRKDRRDFSSKNASNFTHHTHVTDETELVNVRQKMETAL